METLNNNCSDNLDIDASSNIRNSNNANVTGCTKIRQMTRYRNPMLYIAKKLFDEFKCNVWFTCDDIKKYADCSKVQYSDKEKERIIKIISSYDCVIYCQKQKLFKFNNLPAVWNEIHIRLNIRPQKKLYDLCKSSKDILQITWELYNQFNIGNEFGTKYIENKLNKFKGKYSLQEIERVNNIISNYACIRYNQKTNNFVFVSEFKSEDVVPILSDMISDMFLSRLFKIFHFNRRFNLTEIFEKVFYIYPGMSTEYFIQKINILINDNKIKVVSSGLFGDNEYQIIDGSY